MTTTINGDSDQYSLRTPAHRFRQGGRDVYAFALDLMTLNRLIPDRIDDKVVKDANRQLTPSHAMRIQKYLDERDDWLLGTLMLGVSPDVVEFVPYQEDNSFSVVGELRIDTKHSDVLKIFDGQHRRRAIKDVITELELNKHRADKLASLRDASVPIVLYAEGRIDALQQMFADAAKTKTIESNTVSRFDLRDAFNLAALWLEEESDLFVGRVEMERASVPRTSQCIIAINQLAATLKTLMVGYRGRVSKDLNDSYMLNLDELYEHCWAWADDFMPSAREEYEGLMAGEIDNSEIPQCRSKTFAYNATVIRLLAGCYYEWVKNGDDWKPLAEFLRGASLKPESGDGTLLVDAGIVASGGITPLPNLRVMDQAIDYIVRRARHFKST